MKGKATWFLEKAVKMAEQRRKNPRGLRLILIVRPGKEAEVAAAARRAGAKVLGTVTGAVLVDVPDASYIESLERIPGVESIAYDAPVVPMEFLLGELSLAAAIGKDPLLSTLSTSDLERLGLAFKISPQVLQRALLEPKLPLLGSPLALLPDSKIIPTSESRKLLEVPSGATVKTRVAVIDSGVTFPHPTVRKVVKHIVLTVDAPFDTMGHGQWCTSTAFGSPWPLTRFGKLEPVVDARDVVHVKIFAAFGPTSTFQVMRAMEIAAQMGAKVVSMSLGGPLQDRVDKQPDARLVCQLSERYGTIFVIAAGNDGPEEYTVASPGASPCAITVASYSITDGDAAWWSSRGPQGGFYKEHRDTFEEDYKRYGDPFLKPTVNAPGGGRASKNAKPDEVIHSGCTGWFESLAPYDHTPMDGLCSMHGTSMATPHVAGLVAYLVDNGLVRGWRDVFEAARRAGREHSVKLGWTLARLGLWRG